MILIFQKIYKVSFVTNYFSVATCSAEGLSAMTPAASLSAFEAFCSPSAAIT